MMECKLEAARELAYHINSPCKCPITGENIRHVYIRMAKRFMERTDCVYSRAFLRKKLEMYSDEE